MMKRALSILLSLLLLLTLFPGCRQQASQPDTPNPAPEPEETVSVRELADSAFLFSGCNEPLNTESLNTDGDAERLTIYIEAICGLTQDQWEDAAIIRGVGASAFEIAALRLPEEEAAAQAETALTDYLSSRESAFTGYAPAEAEMAANGKVLREGRTVGLFICPDPEGAAGAFSAVYSGSTLYPLPEPEPEPEAFTPKYEIQDLLFRLLLEAACPEWSTIVRNNSNPSQDKGWECGKWEWAESVETRYGITADQYENYTHAYWGLHRYDYDEGKFIERNVHEIVIFQAATEDGAKALAQALNDYKSSRLEELGDCQPNESQALNDVTSEDLTAEKEMLESAQAVSSGHYAALIVSEHTADAVLLFPRAVNDPDTSGYFQRYMDGGQSVPPADPDPDYPDRVRFTPPGEEDMTIYDTSAILAAWEAGTPSSLSGDDRAIYDAAEALLAEIMEESMTDLEKEKAAYDWLVENVDYDWTHQDVLEETDRRGFGPYGGLVNRAAVCLGYATSFQLLMNMSGIECITVAGAGSNSTMDHAWNQVKLNGEWYCTDVAWDANARELADDHEWRYFNLTSDEMAKNHQWDYANTPEATATDRGQG